MLVVKLHGKANRTPSLVEALHDCGSSPGIRVIDETLSEAQMRDLQAACDCFVSLHRSEGFGLNIAECMAAGRLVIATDFSGNTDFANAANSRPIPYSMRAVAPGEYLNGRGQWWAEPVHEAAVESMRWAVQHPSLAATLTARAKQDMAAGYSFEVVGRKAMAAIGSRPFRPVAPKVGARAVLPSAAARFASASRSSRNDPCPCGSGRKYKLCHGTMT
jgi:glycosyltransferase involved in cell wall biosynthesis